jgi:hypothetical protein
MSKVAQNVEEEHPLNQHDKLNDIRSDNFLALDLWSFKWWHPPSGDVLRRRKKAVRQRYAHLATQYIEEDAHSAIVVEPLELTNEVSKGTCRHFH